MLRWRRALFLSALALIWIFPPPILAASQESISSDSLPARIPLLDESSLDKFGEPHVRQPSQISIDEEFPPNTLIPIDTTNLRYFSYFSKINRRIEQTYYYPREAANEMLGGVVHLSMEIKRNGNLGKVVVMDSSGKSILDNAAETIVRKAAPFPPIPSRILNVPIKVTTNISFIPTQEAIQKQDGLGLAIPLK